MALQRGDVIEIKLEGIWTLRDYVGKSQKKSWN